MIMIMDNANTNVQQYLLPSMYSLLAIERTQIWLAPRPLHADDPQQITFQGAFRDLPETLDNFRWAGITSDCDWSDKGLGMLGVCTLGRVQGNVTS